MDPLIPFIQLTMMLSELNKRSKENRPMVSRILSLISVVLAACLMASCGAGQSHDLVTIRYEQVGACNGFDNGGGITSAGPNAAYVAFRISSIVNTESGARDFNS